jgi:chaperonin GroEL
MIKSNTVIGREALEGMMEGMKMAIDSLRISYGHEGVNAVIEQDLYPFHIVTNDAQAIIQASWVEGKLQERGLGFLKELSDNAEKDSGNGRKTTLIIADEILKQGFSSGVSLRKIKKSLDECLPQIVSTIDSIKTTIGLEDIESVATTASENPEIGKIISEIYEKVGKDGVIQTECVLGQNGHKYQIIEGVRFQRTGYLSPDMVYDEEARKEKRRETRAVYENPAILVTKKKISTLKEINPLLIKLESMNRKDLVIFTSDMESSIASLIIDAHKNPKMFPNIVIVKAPVVMRDMIYEDFAKCVGATIVEDATGVTFSKLTLEHLGTCGKIIVDKEETLLIGTQDISEHVKELKELGDNDSLLRSQWLSTKTAILRLGGEDESTLSYLRAKTSDAINSSMLALKDGVVLGGGVCLDDVAEKIKELPETIGTKILYEALKEPKRQIEKNAEEPVNKEDIIKNNVLDATLVIKNAISNSISLIGTLLTAGVVISKPEKNAQQIAHDILSGVGARPF